MGISMAEIHIYFHLSSFHLEYVDKIVCHDIQEAL